MPEQPIYNHEGNILDPDRIIEQWFQNHFPNSAISRQTDCWNLALAAKEDLRARFKGA